MTDLANATLEGLIHDTRNRIERYQQSLDRYSGVLLGQGHVVAMPGGLYLHVETEPDPETPGRHRIIGHTVLPDPDRASCFTAEDAQHLAVNTRNGAGERGTALHITDALEEAIGRERHVLAMMEGKEDEEQSAGDCDHDWEDMGDGTMACTYLDCSAVRAKRTEDEEGAAS